MNHPPPADPPPSPKSKRIEAFWARPSAKGVFVSLWITEVTTEGAPTFDGRIGDTRVALWIRDSAANGSFLSVHAARKDDKGLYPRLGSANVVVNSLGKVRLAIKLRDAAEKGLPQPIWASVSQRAPLDLLVRCGLRLDVLQAKRAQHEASRAAAGAAQAEASAQ